MYQIEDYDKLRIEMVARRTVAQERLTKYMQDLAQNPCAVVAQQDEIMRIVHRCDVADKLLTAADNHIRQNKPWLVFKANVVNHWLDRLLWWAAHPEQGSNDANNRAHRFNLAEHAELLYDLAWVPRVAFNDE